MPQWSAHIRAVVFHLLYRFKRDTRLCTQLVKFDTLYSLLVPRPGNLPFFSPSLLHPVIVSFFCRCHCLPCPPQVSVCLLPPPHSNPYPQCPICCPTKVHKQSRINLIRDRVLTLPNVILHFLKNRLLPCHFHRGVITLPA